MVSSPRPTPPADVSIDKTAEPSTIRLIGSWTTHHLVTLEAKVASLRWPAGPEVIIDGSEMGPIDTSGVWLLRQMMATLEGKGMKPVLRGLSSEYLDLLELVKERLVAVDNVPPPPRQNPFEKVGRTSWSQAKESLALVAFIGETTIAFLRQLKNPRRIRWRTLARIVEQTGVTALSIVGLLSFLLGIVISYQGGIQLKTYGANIFIVELVCLIMLRELAPLIAAIIIAGRTGSAYTAEIGTMRVTEEIDALETIGIGPFDQLVLPKVLGLMITLPLLTVFADVMGILGGMVMASNVLDVSFTDFVMRIPQAVGVESFVVGVIKAPVFAMIISMVGCFQGFQVSGGADSVGRQTTISVVQSIFLVIIADAAFSILFSWLGI